MRCHDAERQQDANGAARDVHPEVADRLATVAGQPAHQGNRDREPHGGGQEVLDREAGHLHRVSERRLRRVGLPVGVRDERHRGVERERGVHVGKAERVRQRGLQPLHPVQEHHAHSGEGEHGDRVGPPRLLAARVDAEHAIRRALGDAVLWAREGPRHVVAERPVEHGQHQHDDSGLRHCVESLHVRTLRSSQNLSGRTSAYVRRPSAAIAIAAAIHASTVTASPVPRRSGARCRTARRSRPRRRCLPSRRSLLGHPIGADTSSTDPRCEPAIAVLTESIRARPATASGPRGRPLVPWTYGTATPAEFWEEPLRGRGSRVVRQAQPGAGGRRRPYCARAAPSTSVAARGPTLSGLASRAGRPWAWISRRRRSRAAGQRRRGAAFRGCGSRHTTSLRGTRRSRLTW